MTTTCQLDGHTTSSSGVAKLVVVQAAGGRDDSAPYVTQDFVRNVTLDFVSPPAKTDAAGLFACPQMTLHAQMAFTPASFKQDTAARDQSTCHGEHDAISGK